MTQKVKSARYRKLISGADTTPKIYDAQHIAIIENIGYCSFLLHKEQLPHPDWQLFFFRAIEMIDTMHKTARAAIIIKSAILKSPVI
ncbi:MAG: hypothetical protein IK072_00830 [Clostridia bacterium]|nr:hypothetical protein [Clostridia bacterium]